MTKRERKRVRLFATLTGMALILGGCTSSAPAPISKGTDQFKVVSEAADPNAGKVVVNITVAKTASRSGVTSAAESVIQSRRPAYSEITVRTFLEGSSSDIPYAVSKLDAGLITHRFDESGTTQRIPTH